MSAKSLISIPYKIKRSPTDLLKALSKTVALEGNTPHYSALDDSILTHQTSLDKKKHFLAQAAGVKAARFMIQKYPEGFMKNDCAPHVQKFFPEYSFSEEELKYPNEDLVYSMMSWGKFRQAYDTYLKCNDLNIEVSESCKLTLLDFLCIHNSKEEIKKLPVHEKWFAETQLTSWELERLSKINMQSTWTKGGLAEQLFNSLKEKNALAYCSLIKGMAKYLEEKMAMKYYKEMQEKGLKPDLSTYNEIIKIIKYENQTNEQKTESIMNVLTEIKNNNLRPNLTTFNYALATISNFGSDQNSIVFALNVLKEMEFLKIEPCLATWNSVIDIFYPARAIGGRTNILPQILQKIEETDLSSGGLIWRDINDANFFKNAMDKILNHGQNADCLHHLHAILMRNNNIKFLSRESSLNGYFDCYFFALFKYEEPEVVISEWRKLTPFIYSRGIKIMTRIIQYTIDYQCFHFIPEIWSHFVEGKFRRDKKFSAETIDKFLSLMVTYQPETPDDPLFAQYGDLCDIMIKNYPYLEPVREQSFAPKEDDRPAYVFEFNWTPKMLSNFFIIAANTKKSALISKEFEIFLKNQMKIPGELNDSCLNTLFDAFFEERNVEKAIAVLNLASNYQLSDLVNDFKGKLRELKDLSNDEKELMEQLKSKSKTSHKKLRQ